MDDISFDVPEGQLFCLLGPNGAGKTTTVSILTTTLAPTSGRVLHRSAATSSRSKAEAAGRSASSSRTHRSTSHLTAEENIRLHAALYGLYPGGRCTA